MQRRENLMTRKRNALIIHGGGLVDPSKFVLMELANQLSRRNLYDKIYIGRYSFESLYTPEFLLEYNSRLIEMLKTKRGSYFGTCRDIELTDPILADKAIKCLKGKDISTIIVGGGDGSSRQVAEIYETFEKNGINIIFAIPLTIDGINGGDYVGHRQAVRESVRQIENIASTSLETRNGGKFGAVLAELQGRNRDDIIASVVKHFHMRRKVADIPFEQLLFKAVPATIDSNKEDLIEEISKSPERTLVLISEGSKISMSDLINEIKGRKVRTLKVGHQSQSNGLTTEEDEHEYSIWIEKIVDLIAEYPFETFTIVRQGVIYNKALINYYAQLNPREGQKADLPKESREIIERYVS